MTSLTREPASFRDPDARVFLKDGQVHRAFTPRGAELFRAWQETGLPERLVAEKKLIASESLPDTEPLTLHHPRIPFVSYAYEWSFEMLRSAGLLELELAREALDGGFLLKDATPDNVQFIGTRPIHIDVASFAFREEGAPWNAYTQFCQTILNPLLLRSLTGMAFQPWLRGNPDGIAPGELSRLLPWWKKLRRGVFTDVVVQGWLQNKFGSEKEEVTGNLSVRKEIITALLGRLNSTLSRLKDQSPDRMWSEYQSDPAKEQFVEQVLREQQPGQVWDLGCNTGHFSLLAARHAKYVIAMDSNSAVVDQLYRRARNEAPDNLLPLVMDLMNPSPGLGWGGIEKRALLDRGRPDLCLCLALLHHLRLAGNLPLSRFLEWLSELTPAAIVEFIPKDDPQAQRLLRWRKDVYPDYTPETFESEVKRHFRITGSQKLPQSNRVLYSISK